MVGVVSTFVVWGLRRSLGGGEGEGRGLEGLVVWWFGGLVYMRAGVKGRWRQVERRGLRPEKRCGRGGPVKGRKSWKETGKARRMERWNDKEKCRKLGNIGGCEGENGKGGEREARRLGFSAI